MCASGHLESDATRAGDQRLEARRDSAAPRRPGGEGEGLCVFGDSRQEAFAKHGIMDPGRSLEQLFACTGNCFTELGPFALFRERLRVHQAHQRLSLFDRAERTEQLERLPGDDQRLPSATLSQESAREDRESAGAEWGY